MDFSGEVAEWQRSVSEGKAGNSRRYAVLEGLEVRSGKSYLDVGCGGGHLVRELGNAAGIEGRVVGVDSSPQMLENARAICQGQEEASRCGCSALQVRLDHATPHRQRPDRYTYRRTFSRVDSSATAHC